MCFSVKNNSSFFATRTGRVSASNLADQTQGVSSTGTIRIRSGNVRRDDPITERGDRNM